jgi:DNA repair protein RecN (Recombination protein N)
VLEEIRITNLGVIDEAVVELGPGLNAVSGETGAGKTMVVSGLSLLLGARADSGLVRAGSQRAAVEGTLRVTNQRDVLTRLAELDATVDDDGTLIVSRTVAADGRSRAFVGGRAVPVGVLAEIMTSLVAVHGQAEQMRLRQPATHRRVLDQYAGGAVEQTLTAYETTYRRHREALAELRDVTTRMQERAREADALRFGLDEVAAAAPEAGEDVALAAEIARLTHVDALQTATSAARAGLSGDVDTDDSVDAQILLARARTALDSAAAHDPALGEFAQRLRETEVLLADVAADVASYAASLDADPTRLATAMDRQATLVRLIRKYAANDTGVDGVLDWARTATRRLATLDDDDDRVSRLTETRDQLAAQLTGLVSALTDARCKAARRLERAVATELKELAMADARLTVAVSATEPGPSGADLVEFRLAAHAGAPDRPVQKAASGGELSRIMLALEVVVAAKAPVPTFVFDEVDAGVGGRAAAEVGRRLAALARTAQVVVVTHLPQIAAYADRHLLVEKSSATRGAVVTSDVVALENADRVIELSRMLAGQADSDLARGHAEELLAAAAADRSLTSS